MVMMRSCRAGVLGALVALAAVWWLVAADSPQVPKDLRDTSMKAFKDGNWKDSYEGLRKLALDPQDDSGKVVSDFNTAVQCLQNLGRIEEVDDFREGVISAHQGNWRLLQAAGDNYVAVDHNGYMISGKFNRGPHRGGGKQMNAVQRDRTRAMQLYQQAIDKSKDEKDKGAAASLCLAYANVMLNGTGRHEPWRLQYLTDLNQLPDYDEGWWYPWWYQHETRGAPVDADGKPVFHQKPKDWSDSQSDGERWRWLLARATDLDPGRTNEIDMQFANFLRSQFGEATMQQFGYWGQPADDGNESGTYALHTLKDTETIARLANGIKRFDLPDEFNYIKVYERVAANGKSQWGEQARDALGNIYLDRRQFVKAGSAWKKSIDEYGAGHDDFRKKQLDQIVGNWGRFEGIGAQPAGTKATVDFRFRNGKKVTFEAHAIKMGKLLDDVKAYLKTGPERPGWEQTDISNLGYRLVEKQQQQYIGDKVANWDLELKPRAAHVDDRVTVTTPLTKAGAYLLTAKMEDGNLSRIIVWITDTCIAKKQLDGKVYYFIADAVTGKPVPKSNVEFFGWKTVPINNNTSWKAVSTEFTETADADGQLILNGGQLPSDYTWLITAGKDKDDKDAANRLGYLGFTNVWYGRIHDEEYKATRTFTMTDRPVYRPTQTVHFKFWVRHSKYDEPNVSDFADHTFSVEIRNPKGEKILDKSYTSDEYAGTEGDYTLPAGAMLGMYHIHIPHYGDSYFRVEEYKKPEFEVKIDAPKEPVQLGEVVNATIEAKYYFGAPVTKGTVKYKVLRQNQSSNWYPHGTWDWFYGAGYWWFAADYAWFPGFGEWGCRRPIPWWWQHNEGPPEVVFENEVPVGPEGKVMVPIDTMPAKELHGNTDHRYTIVAEVVDESRRMISGTGTVLVSRKPFQVYSWVDHGHYRVGDTIKASFRGQTLDNKPVEGKGELTLYKISYENSKPVEKSVNSWKVDTNVEGYANQQLKASEVGQYRLSYKLTDAKKHTIEGGYLFVVRGEGFDGKDFRFNDLELVTDKREYAPGEKVKLMINTNKSDSTVILFVRPTNGVYLEPKLIRKTGKSIEEQIEVIQKDMPNFFVEALTVADGKVHQETREVIVPPEKRIINVEVLPNQTEYKPGQKAEVKVKLTDLEGKPFVGSAVMTVYDKSVEYISGGSNVPADIKEYFWKWRRHHYPSVEASLQRGFDNMLRQHEIGMSNLGIFGANIVEELRDQLERESGGDKGKNKDGAGGPPGAPGGGGGFGGGRRGEGHDADEKKADDRAPGEKPASNEQQAGQGQPPTGDPSQPTIRKNFADTAFWKGDIKTDKDGIATITFTMPENLTGWKIKTWAMGHGTKVGQGEVEVTTKKNILVRLQAPRFFVQKDEVIVSANVHNYLKSDKQVDVSLELDGPTLACLGDMKQKVFIKAGGEQRVDWRVAVREEGQAVVRMKAVTDEESDAMEMRFPAYVHGMLKMDSFSGVVRPSQDSGTVSFTVPKERRPEQSRVEVRYSPTLAGAMVDALPYLVDYPFGCTEQTLNRFLPAAITNKVLVKMNLDLKEIHKKRVNLNSQEIGDDRERAKGWKRLDHDPVFDADELSQITRAGIDRLASMQCSDGGWGWFSGWGERSYPHTTAVVVHGLQIAREADVNMPQGMLERGVEWLKSYQSGEIQKIKNAPGKVQPWKDKADALDAFVFMILNDAGTDNTEMRDFLYRDRIDLPVYAKAMYGLALVKTNQSEKLQMILKNIEQYVQIDKENQTSYLKLPESNYWWCWYGSEIEADAYYLKLLSRTTPRDEKASGLVKYLLNNRKHSTYWNSTRDTAICIEAMADYIKASGEDSPDMTVEIWLDGTKRKEVKIDKTNLFSFDNQFVLFGEAVEAGEHKLQVKRKGTGPVYFNVYSTNFTLEDHITKAGLEVKVERKYYLLTKVDKTEKVPGSRGQPLDQKVEKYLRTELADMSKLKSGDLVEVEMSIDSKNDYEYLIFEDFKPAGFEPLLVRSGYNQNEMGAYMELRDEKVCFFVRQLARGHHSMSYRMRAEIPGKFSALPTTGYAMYAPELKGNSDEIKLMITDK
jgi:uncharacterized protein YfaS (alpha-2-macroglobulin family)